MIEIPDFLKGKKINGNFILLQEFKESEHYKCEEKYKHWLAKDTVNLSIEVYNLITKKSSIKTLHKSSKGLYFTGSADTGKMYTGNKRFYISDFKEQK